MRLSLVLILMPQLALAHPGHIADVAGHDHWIAGAAIGVAIAVSIWGALKGRKDRDASVGSVEDEAEVDEVIDGEEALA